MRSDVSQICATLILGDSLVAGEGSVDGQGWAQQLAAAIGAGVLGVPGATSQDIIAHLPDAVCDLVIVQIGTNDARFRHGKNATETTLSQYHDNLGHIVRHFRDRAPGVRFVFVDTLFVEERKTVLYRADRSYFARDLHQVSQALQRFCADHDHRFIGLDALGRHAEQLTDGLHPAQSIHDRIAALVQRCLPLLPVSTAPGV